MDVRARRVVAATVTGSGLVFLDLSSVNVILPILQQELDTDFVGAQWVVEAFILLLAALILTGGSLADRYGRRRVFAIGCIGFAAASLLAAWAPTIQVLVAGRAAQGATAALIAPAALALITEATPARERSAAFGVWAAVTGLTTAGGPLLAGFLADQASWRWFFGIQPAIALVALWLLRHTGRDTPQPRRLDLVGAALATLGLAGLTYGLLEAGRRTFSSPHAWGGIALGLLLLALFVDTQRRVREPLLPLDVFRDRGFAGANTATLFIYAALSSTLFFVPFNLIHVQGWSATAAGAATLPFALLLAGLSPVAGRIADAIGPKWPMVAGALVTAAGHALLARPGLDTGYWTGFFPGFLLLGIGMATLIPALTATVESTVPKAHVGLAGGINNAVARAAGLLAIAALGVVAIQVFAAGLPPELVDQVDTTQLSAAEGPGADRPIHEAFLTAYRTVVLVAAGLCLLGAWAAWRSAPAALEDR